MSFLFVSSLFSSELGGVVEEGSGYVDISSSSSDGDQEEEENEVEVEDAQRHISSSSFLPQKITRSKAKGLGSRLQMFSLFVVSFA